MKNWILFYLGLGTLIYIRNKTRNGGSLIKGVKRDASSIFSAVPTNEPFPDSIDQITPADPDYDIARYSNYV